MANPIYSAMNGHSNPQISNLANMMRAFQQFRAGFSGDPRRQVQQLLDSGRMTQQQYNELCQLAHQFQGMMR